MQHNFVYRINCLSCRLIFVDADKNHKIWLKINYLQLTEFAKILEGFVMYLFNRISA